MRTLQPGLALRCSMIASIVTLHMILLHGPMASREDKYMHRSIALSNVVMLL